MYFLVYALISALLVTAILAAVRTQLPIEKWKISAMTGAAVGLIGWLVMPVFAWNFSENWLILLFIGIVLVGPTFRKPFSSPRIAWTPIAIAAVVLLAVQPITTSPIFHADAYRELLGKVNTREFSSDMSPVSLDQIRRVDQLLARTLGEKRVEEIPGLGSRARLGKMNIQSINGCFGIREGNGRSQELCLENKLMWAGPLVHESFLKYWANETTPGYVLVSATDPTEVYFVTAIRSKSGTYEPVMLKYFSEGYLGSYVERHLRTAGDISSGFAEYAFEINDEGRPYWVTAKYERKIGFGGADANGVVFVDAQSGQINESTIDLAPTWIDRIQPVPIVTAQLDNWGLYVKGWWNSVFARQDVIQTTPGMSLVYGGDGKSYWYAGMQSAGSEQASNSFVLVSTRTKEVRRYLISGANESAAMGQAEAHPEAKKAGLWATVPILYNVGGKPTYFITLKGSSGVAQLYTFVNMQSYETVGLGRNVQEALRDYQNSIARQEHRLAPDGPVQRKRLEATVLAATKDGDFYFLLLTGQDGKEFYGSSSVSPELKWTKPGDTVVLEVDEGDLRSIPIGRFDNKALSISFED